MACSQAQKQVPEPDLSTLETQDPNAPVPVETTVAENSSATPEDNSVVAIDVSKEDTHETTITAATKKLTEQVQQVIDPTPPSQISNIHTSGSRTSQDSRTTTNSNIYVSWSEDNVSDISKWIVMQFESSNCSGIPTNLFETQNQYFNFEAAVDMIYSFKIKAINTALLETVSECSGDITRISAQTAVTNPSISINAGDTYTKTQTVTLTLSATNATQLYVTNDEGCNSGGTWQTYTINKSWNLAQTNTTATVYVKYKDSLNRESDCINDTIIHDSIAPTVNSFSFHSTVLSSDEYGVFIRSTVLTLDIGASHANKMYVTNTENCAANGTWENYNTTKTWTLAHTNAVNSVYIKFKDVAENETDCQNIQIHHKDIAVPIYPVVYVNWTGSASAETTSSANVNLYLYAGDDQLSEVAISNGTECTGTWETFTPNYNLYPDTTAYQKAWTLSGTSGIAHVSAKYKDASGNESGCATAAIRLVSMNNTSRVFTGPSHTCLLSTDGKAKCFGRNEYGQLGYGFTQAIVDANGIGKTSATVGLNSNEINVGTGKTILQLSLGVRHTCALLNDQTVKCWGGSPFGEVGLGSTDTVMTMGDSLQAVNLGGPVAEITSGYYHTCARMTSGQVKCWGINTFAQLGLGHTDHVGNSANPVFNSVELGTNKTAIQVVAGSLFTCALLNDHTAKCWGQNSNKQLGQDIANFTGDGSNLIGNHPNQLGDNLPAILVGVNKTITQLAAGAAHGCALLNDGGVKCWGSFSSGQLGYQTDGNRSLTGNNRPYIDFGPSSYSVTNVVAGDEHTCVIVSGRTKCWGKNTSGQLGQENLTTIGLQNAMYDDTVFPFINLGTNKTVSAMDAGTSHTCAVFTDGTAKCWGSSGYGQLGIGTTNNIGDASSEMDSLLPEI